MTDIIYISAGPKPAIGVNIVAVPTLTRIGAGPTYEFLSGGTSTAVSITSGGTEIIANRGIAKSTTIGDGGLQTVLSGGVTSFTAISSGGSETVSSGGVASDTMVGNGGLLTVFFGGSANSTTVSSGGSEVVFSGGTASAGILSGGAETISAGGSQIGAILSGGSQTVLGTAWGTLLDGEATQIVSSGGVASGTVVGATDTLIIQGGGTAVGATVSSGGTEIVSSGATASNTTVSNRGTLELFGGAILDGATTIASGGTLEIASGYRLGTGTTIAGLSGGTVSVGVTLAVAASGAVSSATIDSGGSAIVLPSGSASDTEIKTGGSEMVSAGGSDNGAVLSGGTQTVLGTAAGARLDGSATQIVSSGGVASATAVGATDTLTILSGGTAISASVSNGGSEIVSSGGVASYATVLSGGTMTLLRGASLRGAITFNGSGGLVEFGGPPQPNNTISGVAVGDTIELTFIGFVSGGSATLGPGNVLQITEGGQSATLQLDPNASYANDLFQLAADGSGGTDVSEALDTAPPFALDDSPLSLAQGTTATIGPSLLRFGATDTTASGLTYTVTSAPADGTLLLNGTPTASFTGAEVNAGELSYRETVPGATADGFSFKVSDPNGNTTATQTFDFQIVSTVPPFEIEDTPLSLSQGATAPIGLSLLRFGDVATTAAQETYTVTGGPSDGTLLLNGAPTTSFTGAEINAGQLSYKETALGATSDSFSFKVSDPYGNTTATQTFDFQIVSTAPPFELDDSPLSLAQGTTATIGPSLLRYGDAASSAAELTYTVTSGPSDGTLLLNGAPTTSFTGAEVNAGDLSYKETALGATSDAFSFKVSDPYGNTTATQTFDFQIVSTAPPFEIDDGPLSIALGATATIGPSLLRYGDVATTAAQELFTVTSGPNDGTLLLNGAPTTSFTGAEVNAGELSYKETAPGATLDSFSFKVSDPYGNLTTTQHFQINI